MERACSSDRGKTTNSTPGSRRARASFQKGVCGTWSRQKASPWVTRWSPGQQQAASKARGPGRGVGPCLTAADQDHHGTEVDLSDEKSHRRRCQPLPACIAIAAEPEPAADTPPADEIWPASRCPRVVGRSGGDHGTRILSAEQNRPGPCQSTRGPDQKLPLRCNSCLIMVCSLKTRTFKEDRPCEGTRSITPIDSGYRRSPQQVDQNPRISHQLCWPRSPLAIAISPVSTITPFVRSGRMSLAILIRRVVVQRRVRKGMTTQVVIGPSRCDHS